MIQNEAQLVQSAAEDTQQELDLLKETHASDLEQMDALRKELREEGQRCQQVEGALSKAQERLEAMEQQLKIVNAKERALEEASAQTSTDLAAKQSEIQRLSREKSELETTLQTVEQNAMESENALKISRVLGLSGSSAQAGLRDTESQLTMIRSDLRTAQVSSRGNPQTSAFPILRATSLCPPSSTIICLPGSSYDIRELNSVVALSLLCFRRSSLKARRRGSSSLIIALHLRRSFTLSSSG